MKKLLNWLKISLQAYYTPGENYNWVNEVGTGLRWWPIVHSLMSSLDGAHWMVFNWGSVETHVLQGFHQCLFLILFSNILLGMITYSNAVYVNFEYIDNFWCINWYCQFNSVFKKQNLKIKVLLPFLEIYLDFLSMCPWKIINLGFFICDTLFSRNTSS